MYVYVLALTIFNFTVGLAYASPTVIKDLRIPFLDTNPLFGVKLFDYLDWCKVAKLIIEGLHLTEDGINLIREIKSGMNTSRDNTDI